MATATTSVGQRPSPKAQELYDERLARAEDNLAGSHEIAEKAAQHVGSFITSCQASRTILDDTMVVLYGLWNGNPVSHYVPAARSVHVPEAYKAVEGLVPRVVDILTGRRQWFRVVGVDELGKKNAATIEKLIRTQLRIDGFARKFASIVRDTAIYGWKPATVRWKQRTRTIKYTAVQEVPGSNAAVTGQKKLKSTQRVATITFDGPTVEPVDVFDYFVDLRFHDIQDSPGICIRHEVSEAELREGERRHKFKNVQALIDSDKAGTTSERFVQSGSGASFTPSTFRTARDSANGIGTDFYGEKTPARRYELWQFWGRFDPGFDPATKTYGEEKEYSIIMGRKMVDRTAQGGLVPLHISENSYWHGLRPSVVAHFTRRSHCFQSIGLIEPVVRLCQELDDSRNMALQARSLAAMPVIVATDDADLPSTNVVLSPGQVLRARTVDAYKPFFIPDRSDAAYKAEQAIKQDIHETTGVIKLFEGGGAGQGRTATETVSQVREANKRIAEVARNTAEEMLVPMLEMFHSMNQQMITMEALLEIVGEDGLVADIQRIGPEEVAGRVHFEVVAMPQIEMAGIRSRSIMNFANAALPYYQLDPEIINPEYLLRKAWEENFGTQEIDKAFPRANMPDHIRTSFQEHMLMGVGRDVDVQPNENVQAHLAAHTVFMAEPAFRAWHLDAQVRLRVHIENTKLALAQAAEQSLIPPLSQGLGALPQAPGMAPPGQGAPGQPGPTQGGGGPRGPAPTATGMVRSEAAAVEPREVDI